MEPGTKNNRLSYALVVLIIVQTLCAVFFVYDVLIDALAHVSNRADNIHLFVEIVATIGLALAIFFEISYLRSLLERNAQIERGMRVATGALHDVIEEYFSEWSLTPSERDVALFTIKGLSIAEIAELRDSRDGTIKAHLNGIYRKADVSGRSQLISLLVEDLIAKPLVKVDLQA